MNSVTFSVCHYKGNIKWYLSDIPPCQNMAQGHFKVGGGPQRSKPMRGRNKK